ncbi:MAG: NAD(P)H-hydrate dehydratase [Pseudomonadota bacterium]
MFKVTPDRSVPLYGVEATRRLEQLWQPRLPPHTLMRRAGLATARLALALAPHATRIWIACGPGNNGGDGFEAALQLHLMGKRVHLTWTLRDQDAASCPADARDARERALNAGLTVQDAPPEHFDLSIDALLGIGGTLSPTRAGGSVMIDWLQRMHGSGAPVLCIDLPTGLDADTGVASDGAMPLETTARRRPGKAPNRFTLSLLTLKPGLFTANGRDLAGEVWWDDLGAAAPDTLEQSATLAGMDRFAGYGATRAHASHKGSFGDVAVLGGEMARSIPGASMGGAALLAARAALHAGAGRVFVAMLGEADGPDEVAAGFSLDPVQPELMFRSPAALDLHRQVLVCGCGGGEAIARHLPDILEKAPRVVLDADALNAVAADASLRRLLQARSGRGFMTVMTPHPLEAARLQDSTVTQVQHDRLHAARQLSQQYGAVVALKGSGTVLCGPGSNPWINSTGNALLATAGTGDVLAGMVGAYLAAGDEPLVATARAVYFHGKAADDWALNKSGAPLTASILAGLARP